MSIALVLPGGGARGAYQAGALSVLLPELERRHERIDLYCGTSVGAINATLLASMAQLGASEQAALLLARWRDIGSDDIFSPLLGPAGLAGAVGMFGQATGVPWLSSRSLLDSRPLGRNLEHWVDWRALRANVRDGTVGAVCTIATALTDGAPIAFVDSARGVPDSGSEEIRYVRTTMGPDHVRASAALPILFGPVRITSPRRAEDDYTDGAARLNAPLKPAIDLGADHVVVISFEPLRGGSVRRSPAPASLANIVGIALDGLLLDRLDADLHRMAAINGFFTDAHDPSHTTAARAYREARGRHPYRRIAYAIVTPRRRREIAEAAERVYAARCFPRDPRRLVSHLLLGRMFGLGDGKGGGELLSYLWFEPAFLEELIGIGRRDARRWLKSHPRLWCSDPRHDFDLDPERAVAEREQSSLSEWRALRSR
jgi:NTE family protein